MMRCCNFSGSANRVDSVKVRNQSGSRKRNLGWTNFRYIFLGYHLHCFMHYCRNISEGVRYIHVYTYILVYNLDGNNFTVKKGILRLF